jgi:Tfp pilus assembly protein PilO
MMEALSLFQALLAIAVSVAGWFLRSLWSNQTALEKTLMQHQMEVAEKYVRKDDYRVDLQEVKAMLDKIFTLLNTKADKP